jgi:hypothetical protein
MARTPIRRRRSHSSRLDTQIRRLYRKLPRGEQYLVNGCAVILGREGLDGLETVIDRLHESILQVQARSRRSKARARACATGRRIDREPITSFAGDRSGSGVAEGVR